MKTSDTIKNISEALINASIELENITPNQDGYGYQYADLASIITKSKPILYKNKLVIIQTVGESEKSVKITTRLLHSTGEYIEDSYDLPSVQLKGTNEIQKMGAAITYGRRYGISCILGIATEDDSDGTIKGQPEQKSTVQKSTEKKDQKFPGEEKDIITLIEMSQISKEEQAVIINKLQSLKEPAQKTAYTKFIKQRMGL